MPDPAAPLSVVCLAPTIPTRGENLVVSFRVPPPQFTEGLWKITLEAKVVGGNWTPSETRSGTFTTDLEVQYFRVPDARTIRLTVEHQGDPVVFELETHAIALPPAVDALLTDASLTDDLLVKPPVVKNVYYGVVYVDGVTKSDALNGYFAQIGADTWASVDEYGAADSRGVTVTSGGSGALVRQGTTFSRVSDSLGPLDPTGWYDLLEGKFYLVFFVEPPPHMKQ